MSSFCSVVLPDTHIKIVCAKKEHQKTIFCFIYIYYLISLNKLDQFKNIYLENEASGHLPLFLFTFNQIDEYIDDC